MKKLTEQRIRNSIQKFYSSIKNDENARYKSWEYCYKIFGEKQNKTDPETIDLLCLHLGFYLASWGMYRGSSFLLQKDYKVHKDAVLEMQKEKYNILRSATPEQLISKDSLKAIEELHEKLQDIYLSIKQSVTDSKTSITDTLITKILMGVYGCVPAYDRYVKYTLKEYNIGHPSFCSSRLKELNEIYLEWKSVIDDENQKINSNGIKYPTMKILDILFWQIGFDDDIEGSLKTNDEV